MIEEIRKNYRENIISKIKNLSYEQKKKLEYLKFQCRALSCSVRENDDYRAYIIRDNLKYAAENLDNLQVGWDIQNFVAAHRWEDKEILGV